MYRKYSSISDMPQIVRHEERGSVPKAKEEPLEVHKKNMEEEIGFIRDGKVMGRYETDDIILIMIAIILIADDCEDKLLLLALGFVFITGII